MNERKRWLLSLVSITALAGLGIVEAARVDHTGLAGLLCVIALVAVGLAWVLRRRAPVPVRTDLAKWLEDTSAITGESSTELADRAVSSYRAAMHDDSDS